MLRVGHGDGRGINFQVAAGAGGGAVGGVNRVGRTAGAAGSRSAAVYGANAGIETRPGYLAAEGDERGGFAPVKVFVDGVRPAHVGLAFQARGDADEICQAAVAAGGAADAHSAYLAKVVGDL